MATGLGTLTVWLTANTSEYQNGMKKAQATLSDFSRYATVGLAAAGAAITAFGVQSVRAFMEQEDATNRLAVALANAGNQSTIMLPSLRKFAAEMQKQTIYGDEATEAVMAYGLNLGVTADQIKDATTAAMGLAAKFSIDLNSAMMLIGRASKGETTMLTRYGITLDKTMTKEEKFAALLKIGADAFGLARAETDTTSGALKQMGNAWGDTKEAIGETVVKGLDLVGVFQSLKAKAEGFTAAIEGMDAPTKTFITRLTAMAIGLGGVAATIKLLHVPTMVMGSWLAMRVAVGAVQSAMTRVTITAQTMFPSMTAMAGATNNSILANAASMNAMKFAGTSAFTAVGSAATAVGVAIAGWQIGKKLGEMLELEKHLGKWLFGSDQLEKESAELDKKIAELNQKKQMGRKPEDIAAEKAEKQAAEEVKKLEAEIAELQERISFDRFGLEKQINTLYDRREMIQQKMADTKDEVERLKLAKQNITLAEQIFKLEDDRYNNELDFEAQLAELDKTEAEERVAEAKKRAQMESREKNESPVIKAIQRGSVEALRAESVRLSKDTQIATNTKRTADGISKLVELETRRNTTPSTLQLEDAFA